MAIAIARRFCFFGRSTKGRRNHGRGYRWIFYRRCILSPALLGALILSLPVVWDRAKHGDVVGLRTFPLVSACACACLLLGLYFVEGAAPDAKARLLQGLMPGIGFVGGGAILKQDNTVDGTAAVASIWIVGTIGAATALGARGYAVALSLLNWTILKICSRLKANAPSSYS